MNNNNEADYMKSYLNDLAEHGLTLSELETAAFELCRKNKLSLGIEEVDEAIFAALRQK